MHGFNQSSEFVRDLCTSQKHDIIFLQEHWLTPDSMHKLRNINEHYSCYGISAMEDAVSSGYLIGRPFGGTSILVKKAFSQGVKCILLSDRLVALEICDVLLINLYLPCEDGSVKSLDLLHEILANASATIESSATEHCIFGGDFNTDINSKLSPHSLAINEFLLTYKLTLGQPAAHASTVAYTFSNDKLKRFSIIDFICVSKKLTNCLTGYSSIEHLANHSDHLPINCLLVWPQDSKINKFINVDFQLSKLMAKNKPTSTQPNLRWDHSDTALYYKTTGELLYPVYSELCVYHDQIINNSDCVDAQSAWGYAEASTKIEHFYNRTVDALKASAAISVPLLSPSCLKVWWNSDLSECKKQAFIAHKIWEEADRPKFGILFENKNKKKMNYKHLIKTIRTEASVTISNQLQQSLIDKNTLSFLENIEK